MFDFRIIDVSHFQPLLSQTRLPIDQRAFLYQVALEALNNVAIHAQASAVEVEIKKTAGMDLPDDKRRR